MSETYFMSNKLDKVTIDFSKKLRKWDGFGVNYVETCQTPDYSREPQDYGGFSTLTEDARQEIIELIFGDQGLKPGLVKMFLDPFHQKEGNDNPPDKTTINMENYDHTSTTAWMRYFVREGLRRTRKRGDDLQILTTLYGPPGWMTLQKFNRGRDLDPKYKYECGKYIVSWAKYLIETEGFPVRYVSLHNEGEDYIRWPEDGSKDWFELGHDYNMYWPPEQVNDFLKFMPSILEANGLKDVKVTNGETSNWFRFHQYGYADALCDDEEGMNNLGLITGHGFFYLKYALPYGDMRSAGIDMLREKRPELHCWVTSTSWGKMDAYFVLDIMHSIYAVKVNGIIPWACIQTPALWKKGDPNPGCAFRADGKGGYSVEPGYYFYKQVSRAGQPGTWVARANSTVAEVGAIAFSGEGTKHPDAFTIINVCRNERKLTVNIKGTESKCFEAYRTSPTEKYCFAGNFELDGDKLVYSAPSGSVTTFFGNR